MPPRAFSVPAYLLAVAGGCVLFGVFWVLYEAAVSSTLQLNALFFFPAGVLLIGYFPGLLFCLPTTLLSLWIANRAGLAGAPWYAGFGALTGLAVSIPTFLAFPQTSTAAGVFMPAVFTLAGTGGGLIYFRVEKAEARSRANRQRHEKRLDRPS